MASVSGVGGGAAVAETLTLPLPFLPFIGILHRHSVNICWIEAFLCPGQVVLTRIFHATILGLIYDTRTTVVRRSCYIRASVSRHSCEFILSQFCRDC